MVQLAVVPAVKCTLSVQVFEPADEVAVWVVRTPPPLFGTVQDTTIEAVAALAPMGEVCATVTPVGMPGKPALIEVDAADALPVPYWLVAVTVNV